MKKAHVRANDTRRQRDTGRSRSKPRAKSLSKTRESKRHEWAWTHREIQRASDSQRTQQSKGNVRNYWRQRVPQNTQSGE